MNKIKEAIADLRAYLGRDQEGIRRLDAVANIANEMRKEIATLKEASKKSDELRLLAEVTESSARHAMMEARKGMEEESRQRKTIERELADLQNEVKRLQSEVASIQLKDLPELPDSLSSKQSESPLLRDVHKFTAMFNHVRREMRVAPTPMGQEKAATKGAVYELTDIVTGYDSDEMIRLGRFVTSLAMMNLPGRIVAQSNFRTCKRGRMLVESKGEDFMRDFVYWIRSNIQDGQFKKSCKRTITDQFRDNVLPPL